MTNRLTPSVWARQAEEVSDVARQGSLRIADVIGATAVPPGSGLIDQAIQEHLARLRGDASVAAALGSRLERQGGRMVATGQNFRAVEETNEALAQRLGGT